MMSSLLRALWQNTVGLFVDDGFIAAGTLLAVLVVAIWSWLTTADTPLRDLGGPLLFALLMALLVTNVYGAARAVVRRRVDPRPPADPIVLDTALPSRSVPHPPGSG